jgi:Cu2+-exporting ATPase/Cu+-exporting ATPase
MTTKTFPVEGMDCASCAAIITKTIKKMPGVKDVAVNFATEEAKIEFEDKTMNVEKINSTLEKLGYKLKTNVAENHVHHTEDHTQHDEKQENLKKKAREVMVSLPIAGIVFVVMIYDLITRIFPVLPKLSIPMELLNTIGLILASIFLFGVGRPFLLGLLNFIRYRQANMDTLIGMGTFVAYVYSALVTLFPTIKNYLQTGDTTYFDVTIVVIGFITLGKYLELRSKIKTGAAIEKLLGLQAKSALVWRNNRETELPLEQVIVGDIVIIKPGAKIPVDGKIIEGETTIDESMVSGESMPVEKKVDNFVVGSTINKQGYIKFKATKIGNDTVLAQIIKMVRRAQGSKAPIQSLADKISGIFVPIVLVIALSSLMIWLLVGSRYLGFQTAFSYGLMCFVGVLVIACPCALGLATPTAIIVGVGKGAESGILIKDAENLEKLSRVNTVVMDKTGTITLGKPAVTDIKVWEYKEDELIQLTASLEAKSEHPLAEAIVGKAKEKNIALLTVDNFNAESGRGVTGDIENKKIIVRKPTSEETEEYPEISLWQNQGKTVVITIIEGKLAGIISIADTIKSDSKKIIEKLKKQKIKVIMLTGDNHTVAEYIAKEAGIDTVISEIMPEEKATKIKELQAQGNIVAMAGDGINDAPALAQADVGIAMGNGTDVAIETAGITLLHGDIKKINTAITLSRLTLRTIKQNLFWAFIYNLIGIPLATGALFPFFGILLNPIFASGAMALSSVSVVTNSLRIKSKHLI